MPRFGRKIERKSREEMLRWLWAYTHGAPRTWSEIVGALTGLGSTLERDGYELTDDEDEAVGYYSRLLRNLYEDNFIAREYASDPRFDLIWPVETE